MGAPIETKAGAATAATFLAGEIVAAVFTFWPAAADSVTPDQRLQLQAVIATVLTATAAYFASHTHRPDLPPPAAAPVRVIEQPPPDAGDSD